jgi:uncharacterized paraquat-inducible protein A
MDALVVIILFQAVIVGSFTAFIAKEKKRDALAWFVLGFFFSLIALLALIAVPTKKVSETILRRNTISQTKWQCKECGETNVDEDVKCYFCGKARPT